MANVMPVIILILEALVQRIGAASSAPIRAPPHRWLPPQIETLGCDQLRRLSHIHFAFWCFFLLFNHNLRFLNAILANVCWLDR